MKLKIILQMYRWRNAMSKIRENIEEVVGVSIGNKESVEEYIKRLAVSCSALEDKDYDMLAEESQIYIESVIDTINKSNGDISGGIPLFPDSEDEEVVPRQKVKTKSKAVKKVASKKKRIAKPKAEDKEIAKPKAEDKEIAKPKAEDKEIAKPKAEDKIVIKPKVEKKTFTNTKPKAEKKTAVVTKWNHGLAFDSGKIDEKIIEGITNPVRIAKSLKLTPRRVKEHIRHLRQKHSAKF